MRYLRTSIALLLCLLSLPLTETVPEAAAGTNVSVTEDGTARVAPPWQLPTGEAVRVSRAFDPPPIRWLSGHRGVDLQAGPGATVRAPARGVVVYAGILVDREVISLQHSGGLRSTYEPVTPEVAVGDIVQQGQAIGRLTSGHRAGALHWGAKYSGDVYIDPLSMVMGEATLKPW